MPPSKSSPIIGFADNNERRKTSAAFFAGAACALGYEVRGCHADGAKDLSILKLVCSECGTASDLKMSHDMLDNFHTFYTDKGNGDRLALRRTIDTQTGHVGTCGRKLEWAAENAAQNAGKLTAI